MLDFSSWATAFHQDHSDLASNTRRSQIMKTILTLLTLLLLVSLPALCQVSGQNLEQQAEQRFEENDLAAATLLYRQAAARQEKVAEKVRLLTTAAWVEHLSGQENAALGTLTEALELQPDYPFRGELYDDGFRDLFYEAQKEALARRHNQALTRISQARKLIADGSLEAARKLLLEALERQRDQPQALFNLALIDLRQQHLEAAIDGFEKVIALHNRKATPLTDNLAPAALTNLGLLYNSRGLYEEAEALLLQAIELNPQQSVAWTNLGISRRNLHQGEGAAEAFRRAYALKPDDPSVLNNLSLAHIDNQDWVAAVGLLVEATGRFQDNPNLWLNLGVAQRGLGNPGGAVRSFETVIRLDPDNERGLALSAALRLAGHFFAQEEHTQSLAEAQRVIAWRPDQAEGWVYQGLAQRALGDFGGARVSLLEAIRLDPTGVEIHNNLGSVYVALGKFQEAEDSFRRALQIDPAFQGALDNLAALAGHRRAHGSNPATPGHAPSIASTPSPTAVRRDTSVVPRTVASTPQPTTTNEPTAPRVAAGAPSQSSREQPSREQSSREHGLTFAQIDYAAMGLQGTLVQAVAPGSAAEKAGILADDLIVRIDEQTVVSGEKLDRYLRQQRDRDAFNLVILRNNLPRQLILRLR